MNCIILEQLGLREYINRYEKGLCPICGKSIDFDIEFKDALSRKEYSISGLCQACQDKVFIGRIFLTES